MGSGDTSTYAKKGGAFELGLPELAASCLASTPFLSTQAMEAGVLCSKG